MRQSITQEFEYGCGIACFAFALGISYKQAVSMLGSKQTNSNRFWIKDLVAALNTAGHPYKSVYIKPRCHKGIYTEGTIVLLRRSKLYPSGHYLIRHNGQWMDPWINMNVSKDISLALSGFRTRLPGSPMYAVLPLI